VIDFSDKYDPEAGEDPHVVPAGCVQAFASRPMPFVTEEESY
jgi:hypothetical protein